jgi:hypothetical protein
MLRRRLALSFERDPLVVLRQLLYNPSAMAASAEVVLWRAPSAACLDPGREMREGFDPAHYPGEGVYLASDKHLALDFQRCYRNGLQEMHLPTDAFEKLLEQGVIRPDGYYPPGQSWHVAQEQIPAFNEAMSHAPVARYSAESPA